MKYFVLSLGFALVLTLVCTGEAQARIFEPQHDWLHSGRICAETRNPPGLAWDDLPPRACVAHEQTSAKQPDATNWADYKALTWSITFERDTDFDKMPEKI